MSGMLHRDRISEAERAEKALQNADEHNAFEQSGPLGIEASRVSPAKGMMIAAIPAALLWAVIIWAIT